MSDWKNVQYKDGKFKTGEGGGGGSSTFSGLDDVDFSNLQNGQVPKYNSTTQKWENANESGGGGTVTDVQVDGVSVVNQQGVAEIEMPIPPTIPVEDVLVNGTSVVDANNEAQIKSYKEVTQAEYQALPSTKLTDNILYCIKDSAGVDGFPPLIYSDEEREVGVWRDGKPLYQKTIYIGTMTVDSNSHNVPHNISNIDLIVDLECFAVNASGNFYPIPIYRVGGTTGVMVGVGATNIFYTNNWTAFSDKCYATIRYTKTTDTAGSGTWTTQGGYAHHYSTSEKVIGTWIDGKPVYEKTYFVDNLVRNDTWQTVATITSFKRLIEISATSYNDSIQGGVSYQLSKNQPQLQVTNAGVIQYAIVSLTDMTDFYLTVRYTKTTD